MPPSLLVGAWGDGPNAQMLKLFQEPWLNSVQPGKLFSCKAAILDEGGLVNARKYFAEPQVKRRRQQPALLAMQDLPERATGAAPGPAPGPSMALQTLTDSLRFASAATGVCLLPSSTGSGPTLHVLS